MDDNDDEDDGADCLGLREYSSPISMDSGERRGRASSTPFASDVITWREDDEPPLVIFDAIRIWSLVRARTQDVDGESVWGRARVRRLRQNSVIVVVKLGRLARGRRLSLPKLLCRRITKRSSRGIDQFKCGEGADPGHSWGAGSEG